MRNTKITKFYISDISQEATISVVATLGNKKIELPAKYAILNPDEQQELISKYDNKVVPLENILKMWQDKLKAINFKGTLSKLELLVITKDGSIYHWENVKIIKYTLASGKSIHILFSKRLEGEKYNRRRGIRINIDKVMDIEQGEEMHSVIVRDLSFCGVAFIEPLRLKLDLQKPFVLHLVDEDDEGNELVIGKIHGYIINIKEDESGGVLYRCNIDAKHYAFLQKYIANKQIEAIRGRRLTKRVEKITTGEYWQEDLAEALKESL